MPYQMSIGCPGTFLVTVYGAFLPRHIFHRFHALCAYLRCIFVALCVLFMWPTFDVVLADQVSVVIPLLKLKKSMKVSILLSYKLLFGCPGITVVSCTTLFCQVVFYCHFPDLLLAQHTTLLRRIYRKPIDFIEEITTGLIPYLDFFYSCKFSLCPQCILMPCNSTISYYFALGTPGMADLILVNSRFTASTFANTFKRLHARGIRPAVLYPAVNVDQFDEPHSNK